MDAKEKDALTKAQAALVKKKELQKVSFAGQGGSGARNGQGGAGRREA